MKLFWATTIALDFCLKNHFYKRAFLYCTILYYTVSKTERMELWKWVILIFIRRLCIANPYPDVYHRLCDLPQLHSAIAR